MNTFEMKNIIRDITDAVPALLGRSIRLQCDILRKTGITRTQKEILFFLHKTNEMTMTDVSKVMAISKPNVTSLIDGLISLELVTRGHNENDRRIVSVKMTEKGKSLIEKFKNDFREQVSLNLKKMSTNELRIIKQAADLLVKHINS